MDEKALVAARPMGASAALASTFSSMNRMCRPLLTLDNVVLQPHRASATAQTRRAMEDLYSPILPRTFRDNVCSVRCREMTGAPHPHNTPAPPLAEST